MRTSLTRRELEILTWVAQGKSDWQIGCILEVSAKTVNFHVENAKRKLDCATRVQAIAHALRAGLIAFPSSSSGAPPSAAPPVCAPGHTPSAFPAGIPVHTPPAGPDHLHTRHRARAPAPLAHRAAWASPAICP